MGVSSDISEVDRILKERGNDWGDAVETHVRIALAWSAILDRTISAHEVALCMAALKLVRASVNPTNEDSSLDGKGYLEIFDEIVEVVGTESIPVIYNRTDDSFM